MQTTRRYFTSYLFFLFSVLLLAGCGGGGNNNTPSTPASANLTFTAIKTFRFTWDDVADATFYRLLENADGQSGFTQVGSDIDPGTQTINHNVPLYARVNAQYILQSCNASGCIDSATILIMDTLVSSIGYFKASNTGEGDRFGFAVSLSADGNTLAVAAVGEDSNTTGVNTTSNDDGTADNSGAVYVFNRSGVTWMQQAYLKASNTGTDLFGLAVSLSADGNTLAVGAIGEDSNTSGVNTTPNDDGTADGSGAAYVFSRSGTSWTQQAYIKASNTGAGDSFGIAVSLSADGNTLAVGANNESSNTTGVNTTPNDDGTADGSGAAYVFSRSGTSWTQQTYIKASNTGAGDRFGGSVSLSTDGNTLAVGASTEDSGTFGVINLPNEDATLSGTIEDATASGAVYVFIRTPTNWVQQAYIKASNTGADDRFGTAVSLSADGNTLAVGAWQEDSNTTGAGSVPNDDGSADNSGAAYVFSRSGTSWTQQAYIKASNTGASDTFGGSVSLSADGNALAVGAWREDSNTTGVGSLPNDNSSSGAAYLFSRSGVRWSEQAYIKASNTGAGDEFGLAVNLSADGKTLAVGAGEEDSNSAGVSSAPNDDGATNGSGAVYLY